MGVTPYGRPPRRHEIPLAIIGTLRFADVEERRVVMIGEARSSGPFARGEAR